MNRACVAQALSPARPESLRLLTLTLLLTATASSQTFEVASFKPSPPLGNTIRVGCSGGPGTSDPTRISCENLSLTSLLMRAFDLKKYQIAGPDWMENTTFNVDAKLPEATTPEQALQMWQALLTERLKLTSHREIRELPVYTLTIAKGGLKMIETTGDAAGPTVNRGGGDGSGNAPAGRGGASATMSQVPEGTPAPSGGRWGRLSGPRLTIAQLITGLNFHLDRPVLDQTGLTGRYKVKLEWQVDEAGKPLGTLGADTAADASISTSIFAAVQEQLGLKLDPRKAPIPMLIIDSASKTPTGN